MTRHHPSGVSVRGKKWSPRVALGQACPDHATGRRAGSITTRRKFYENAPPILPIRRTPITTRPDRPAEITPAGNNSPRVFCQVHFSQFFALFSYLPDKIRNLPRGKSPATPQKSLFFSLFAPFAPVIDNT